MLKTVNDMARYIDVDKMIDGYSTTFPYNLDYCNDGDLMEWLNAQPIADVVPRAEVERIFEEIERIMASYQPHHTVGIWGDNRYAELKKKYTEGQK